MIAISARILIALVAVLHLWFLTLEMFLWQKPLGMKTFRLTKEFAASTASLAANQGLYNGFLAAGLIWGIFDSEPSQAFFIRLFFLSCVIVAGIFGAATVSRRVFWIQAAPAILALACSVGVVRFKL